MTRRDLPLVGAVLDRGSSAFAVVFLVATVKDMLPSSEFSWPNIALASAAACLVMVCAAPALLARHHASQRTASLGSAVEAEPRR